MGAEESIPHAWQRKEYAEPMTTLSFTATRVHEHIDEDVQTLSFEVEADGDPLVYLTLMNEDPSSCCARIWWGNGKEGADECTVHIASIRFTRTSFAVELAEPRPQCLGPYGAFAIAFDELDEPDARAAAEALVAIVGRPNRIEIDPIS